MHIYRNFMGGRTNTAPPWQSHGGAVHPHGPPHLRLWSHGMGLIEWFYTSSLLIFENIPDLCRTPNWNFCSIGRLYCCLHSLDRISWLLMQAYGHAAHLDTFDLWWFGCICDLAVVVPTRQPIDLFSIRSTTVDMDESIASGQWKTPLVS